ncbi:rhomboid family intramembrane serine protease [Stenotrophobium rhamnosiphilum]|uniref:Peptidase S54 rhomboid domain-containing protein n=1 Tax=Stenotrophobium rhamnosiphilum TaxID=2029166 RepID=A0A2T5MKS4_9GAMM|nr:rhomboid family intramembrane serine protease [Stenotrophobium rhamnosiphilum]PTU33159.1 hypothetical protein CJD38_03395 [Stenotrophobium rhamnosiphilum]
MKISKQTERKLERFAIKDLTLYLVGGQGLALLLGLTMPGFIDYMLLIPQAVMSGQWWRLFSFVLTPPSGTPLFAAFALYLLFFMGRSLENQWGTLRYNLFVLIGYLMTIAVAFLIPYGVASNNYITGSIFLAFAFLFPNFEIMLFFVLPVKIKWLALLTWIFYAFSFFTGDWLTRLLILAAVSNFFVFFGKDIYYNARHGHRKIKNQAREIATRDQPRHVCTVCGITDKTNREMDFRYCTKCDPPVAYCMSHLNTHEHKKP